MVKFITFGVLLHQFVPVDDSPVQPVHLDARTAALNVAGQGASAAPDTMAAFVVVALQGAA